jgi:predicted DNA-binding protein (MmcQ/YjbR family)
VDLRELRTHCLQKAGVEDGYPFGPGTLVLKVGGKIFAIIMEDEEPLSVSLKCDPEIAIALRREHEAVEPGYHLNKRHWNTIVLDGTVIDDRVLEWVDDSYDLVRDGLPRRLRDEIGGRSSSRSESHHHHR